MPIGLKEKNGNLWDLVLTIIAALGAIAMLFAGFGYNSINNRLTRMEERDIIAAERYAVIGERVTKVETCQQERIRREAQEILGKYKRFR